MRTLDILYLVVEREQLAEETPILYRLTVGDLSPSPKNKPVDDEQTPQINSAAQQVTSASDAQLRAQTLQEESEKSTVHDTTFSPPVSEVPSDVSGPASQKF